jgi:hypothetical protein
MTNTEIHFFSIRARLNAGATVDEAVKGSIRENGPLRTARVSSAQAKGAAKRYAYWGAVRYQVRLARKTGELINMPLERASSDRRSERLAALDVDALCEREGRAQLGRIGKTPAAVVWAAVS